MYHDELYSQGFRGPKGARLSGIVFPHINPINGEATPGVLRPDASVGASHKYLRPKDHSDTPRNRSMFFTPECKPEKLTKVLKTKPVTLMVCESAAKAMALQSALDPDKFVCMGLSGVAGAAHRRKEMRDLPDGGHEMRPVGDPRLNEWWSEIALLDRRVVIVFDNDTNDPKHAKLYDKKQGTLFEEAKLARLLQERGASVSLANFPFRGKVLGVDDMLASLEEREVLDCVFKKSITKRDRKRIIAGNAGVLEAQNSIEFVQAVPKMTEPLVDHYLMHEGFVTMLGAPDGFGKSFMMLQIAQELALGEPILGAFAVREPVGSLVCNFEMSDSQMAARISKYGFGHEDVHVMHLPLSGFTLNRARFNTYGRKELHEGEGNLRVIVDYMLQHRLKVCFIDNVAKATDGNESDVEMVKELLDDFKRSASYAQICWMLCGHTKKMSKDYGVSRPQDAVIGSTAWARFVDNMIVGFEHGKEDATRSELRFAKVRESRIGNKELHRKQTKGGWNGRFYIEEWKGETAAQDRLNKVLEYFSAGEIVTTESLRELLFPAMTETPEDRKRSATMISKLMNHAVSKGVSTKEERGVWRIGKPAESDT